MSVAAWRDASESEFERRVRLQQAFLKGPRGSADRDDALRRDFFRHLEIEREQYNIHKADE